MLVPRKTDYNKCGVYCIRNTKNSKVYIGASKNIYRRILEHRQILDSTSKKHRNRHLQQDWYVFGRDSFEYSVLEYLEPDNILLRDREYFWMVQYNSTNRNFGYNIRMDNSRDGMIMHDETRQIKSEISVGENNPNYGHHWSREMKKHMSDLKKEQYAKGIIQSNLDATYKGIAVRNQRWAEHPELKEAMAQKLSKINTKYKIYQYTKTHELVRIWNSVKEIIDENPSYKRHNIYAVCSGEKPTMYGYIWVKVLNDDIVRQ